MPAGRMKKIWGFGLEEASILAVGSRLTSVSLESVIAGAQKDTGSAEPHVARRAEHTPYPEPEFPM